MRCDAPDMLCEEKRGYEGVRGSRDRERERRVRVGKLSWVEVEWRHDGKDWISHARREGGNAVGPGGGLNQRKTGGGRFRLEVRAESTS